MDPTWIAVWATALVVAAGAAWYWYRTRGGAHVDGGKLERTMSFMSQSIFENMFPEEADLVSIINNAVLVEEFIAREEVVAMLQKLHKDHPELYRLWSRVVPTEAGDIEFEELKNIDEELDVIVKESTAKSDEEVMNVLQEITSDEYPLDGLLYRFHTIKNENGNSALVVRVHHAVGDGIGLVDVMMKVLTKMDGTLFDLSSVPHKKRHIKFSIRSFLLALAKVAMIPVLKDTPSKLTRRSKPLLKSGKRRFAVSPGFSLDFLRAVKGSFDCPVSVNDVLTAAYSGAVKRYIEEVEPELTGKSMRLRLMMPVTLPRKGDKLRNRWCFVSVSMHGDLDVESRKERLMRVHQEMENVKRGGEAILQLQLQTIGASFTSMQSRRQLITSIFDSHTTIFSNVPGPTEPVKLCGRVIKKFMLPLPNAITQAIVFSYAGSLNLTLTAEEGIVTQPNRLLELFMDELRLFGKEAGVDSGVELLREPLC
mmetsp:Transcript_3266/g.9991  ORF Transcript_3266/g.9991 Transcript_3266/m.9991 type:complete len:481 (-) Transcript_3266:275-1717(-)